MTEWMRASGQQASVYLIVENVQHLLALFREKAECEPAVAIVALDYVRRFARSGWAVKPSSDEYAWLYVMTAALLVASKIVNDHSFRDFDFAILLCDYMYPEQYDEMYDNVLRMVRSWEIELLVALDYRVHFGHDNYDKAYISLRKALEAEAHSTTAEPTTPSPTHTRSPTSVVAHGAVVRRSSYRNKLQLLQTMCNATVRGWFG